MNTDDALDLVIEEQIDAFDLVSVLEAMARICDGKAEHLAVNWQDDTTAGTFKRAARALEKFAQRAVITDASVLRSVPVVYVHCA